MKKFKITAPVANYTGTGWGLTFVAGVAETDDARLAKKLKKRGYKVEEQKQPKATKAEEPKNTEDQPKE